MESRRQRGDFEAILEIARDLTASLAARDRYSRLLDAIRRVIPCDAATLMRLEGTELVPVASHGLRGEALGRRFDRREHPRLDIVLGSEEPVIFPEDSPLEDPFDGLMARDPVALHGIHACLGCRLTDAGQVVGTFTADALDPRAFDGVDRWTIATLGALSGAAMRTTSLIEALERSADRRGLVARELLRTAYRTRGAQLLGTSTAIDRVKKEIATVAGSDLAVLVTGPTGTGKELVVRALHAMSARREEALIHVNCAALPESVAESELFGHVAGAFTGAARDREGKFDIANGGTLFLDEIGELPATVQPKLLRVLQDGEIQRVGSDRVRRVDVRVIAATNRDLEAEVAAGRFRADLFHRLAVYPIHVPPLRQRREDIPALAAHFADVSRRRLGAGAIRFTPDAMDRLMRASWPGNVRELKNVISRAVVRAAASGTDVRSPLVLDAGLLDAAPEPTGVAGGAVDPVSPIGPADSSLTLQERIAAFRVREIEATLGRHEGNMAAAARELGMHRSNFHRLVRRLGLK